LEALASVGPPGSGLLSGDKSATYFTKVAATLVKYVADLASFGGAYAAAHKDDW
jgi:hypothetical protein